MDVNKLHKIKNLKIVSEKFAVFVAGQIIVLNQRFLPVYPLCPETIERVPQHSVTELYMKQQTIPSSMTHIHIHMKVVLHAQSGRTFRFHVEHCREILVHRDR